MGRVLEAVGPEQDPELLFSSPKGLWESEKNGRTAGMDRTVPFSWDWRPVVGVRVWGGGPK